VKAKRAHSKNQKSLGRGVKKIDPNQLYELFRQLLVVARKKSDLSQQEVADRLGRPQTYISKCERGTRRMDVVEFLTLAEVIGFDPIVFIRKLLTR
jgi:ribosome-binding protein aMBF1 (putative translation factor)